MIWGKVISFTDRGAEIGGRIAALLPEDCIERYARGIDPSLRSTSLTRMVQQAMADCNLIVFVGAAGIAVRAIAPYLQGKAYDPAVLVVDENARFVISLVSGHLGGANALAEQLAAGLGAQAVITTATDGRGVFAVDTWAQENRCAVREVDRIKQISAALLRGEQVGVVSDYPIEGALPQQIHTKDAENGFVISTSSNVTPFRNTLHLVPRIVHLGIGCRKGVPAEKIARAVHTALQDADIDRAAICAVASIDLKKDEAGLCAFCAQQNLPFHAFTPDELLEMPGEFTPSAFVRQTVGVDNVCERAALKSANGRLISRKFALDGVTVAIAEEQWRVRF